MAKRGLNIFNSVKLSAVPSSRFNLAHESKISFNMGELVPTACLEAIPGDKFTIGVANMLRFAPLVSPVMHKIGVTTDYYFVPNRILWSEWDKWIANNSDVGEHPYIQFTGVVQQGSVADYLGIPPGAHENARFSALPFAAYLKVYDEYYRDQNLTAPKFVDLVPGDNPDLAEWLTSSPLLRAWQHDYFTAALPFAQKGDAVQLPLISSDTLTVEYQNRAGGAANQNTGLLRTVDGEVFEDDGALVNEAPGPTPLISGLNSSGSFLAYDPAGTLVVDPQADAVDINTVRRAFRLQEWLERLARGGSRYTEIIKSMFNVFSSDARLQRPEFIGRQVQSMVISEVLSTAQTNNGVEVINPVGEMAGHGISAGGGFNGSYYAEEHGWIIGFINVQPTTSYQDGLHKKFHRFDRLDYAWPVFANIGEQEVKQKEIYCFTSGDPDRTFGYVPRYAEYKFENDRVAGEMRDTLAYWHLGRRFDEASTGDPALNEEFILCNPRTDIFAVEDPNVDHIYAHIINNISVRRKLPAFGTPTI